MASPYIFGIINAMHDLFTALWIGGLAFMVVILTPVVRKYFEEKSVQNDFLTKTQKRLKIIAYISMVGLTVTGILMSRQALTKHFDGPFSFTNDYSTLLSIKHILTILMVVIALTKSLILDRLKVKSPALMKARMILIPINLLFGVAVLVLSGMTAALGSLPVT
ncbi:MAG: hypothetical protein ACTSSH_02225 [Candidatus Heimdallarchaeota archaeon]